MTIAVGLLTCDRLASTRTTLETFTAQNPKARERALLLHADDASVGFAEMNALVRAYGFETVTKASTARRGASAMRSALVSAAAAEGAEWILMLENDWEWVRPIPWPLFQFVVATEPDVYCLRLYGAWKGRDRTLPCARRHLGMRGRPAVTWAVLPGAPEPAEVAAIHWGGPPALTRMAEAQRIHARSGRKQTRRLAAVLRNDGLEVRESGHVNGRTVRVMENCVFHLHGPRTADRVLTGAVA